MKSTILHKNKGFTIVELIVVMAIIAILILIAVPTFTRYIEDAENTSEMATANTIFKSSLAAVVDDYTEPTRAEFTVGIIGSDNEIAQNVVSGVSGGVNGDADGKTPLTLYGYSTAPTGRNPATPADSWEVYISSASNLADVDNIIYVISPNGNIYRNGNLSSGTDEAGGLVDGAIDGDCVYRATLGAWYYQMEPNVMVPCASLGHSHPTH